VSREGTDDYDQEISLAEKTAQAT